MIWDDYDDDDGGGGDDGDGDDGGDENGRWLSVAFVLQITMQWFMSWLPTLLKVK